MHHCTVSVSVVERWVGPDVARTAILYFPSGVSKFSWPVPLLPPHATIVNKPHRIRIRPARTAEGPVVVTVSIELVPLAGEEGDIEQVMPTDAGEEQESVTVSLKPFRGTIISERLADPPGCTGANSGGKKLSLKAEVVLRAMPTVLALREMKSLRISPFKSAVAPIGFA
jgi:hypothetical protein